MAIPVAAVASRMSRKKANAIKEEILVRTRGGIFSFYRAADRRKTVYVLCF
jgi:hypothetical protein